MTTSRTEIIGYLPSDGWTEVLSKADLIAAAADRSAPSSVLETLGHLPDRRYGEVRQLWEALPDVPIG